MPNQFIPNATKPLFPSSSSSSFCSPRFIRLLGLANNSRLKYLLRNDALLRFIAIIMLPIQHIDKIRQDEILSAKRGRSASRIRVSYSSSRRLGSTCLLLLIVSIFVGLDNEVLYCCFPLVDWSLKKSGHQQTGGCWWSTPVNLRDLFSGCKLDVVLRLVSCFSLLKRITEELLEGKFDWLRVEGF